MCFLRQVERFFQLLLLQVGTNHAQPARILRASLANLIFTRRQIKIQPGSIRRRQHSLCPQNRSVKGSIRQILQQSLQLGPLIPVRRLRAPACKDLIGVVMAVAVIVAAAGAAVAMLMVMMMSILMRMLVAMLMFVLVAVFMFMPMFVPMFMAAAGAAVVMVMFVGMPMMASVFVRMLMGMLMLMGMRLLLYKLRQHLIRQAMPLFHSFPNLRSRQRIPGSRDDSSLSVVLPQHRNGQLQLLLRRLLRAAEDNRIGALHLIVEKLAEILHI